MYMPRLEDALTPPSASALSRSKYGANIEFEEFHRLALRLKVNASPGSCLGQMRIEEMWALVREQQVRQRDWSPFIRGLKGGDKRHEARQRQQERQPLHDVANVSDPCSWPAPPPFGGIRQVAEPAGTMSAAASRPPDMLGAVVAALPSPPAAVASSASAAGSVAGSTAASSAASADPDPAEAADEFMSAVHAALSSLPSLPPLTPTGQPSPVASNGSALSDDRHRSLMSPPAEVAASSLGLGEPASDAKTPVGTLVPGEPVVGLLVGTTLPTPSPVVEAEPPTATAPLVKPSPFAEWLMIVFGWACLPLGCAAAPQR